MDDLKSNHGRPVVRSFLQHVVDIVGSMAQTTEEDWMYETPKLSDVVTTVSVSLMELVYSCVKKDGEKP
ncbi:Uncharacterised protein [Legionella cincinnatiensis]|uniref:Uncharacterized protein n=1 Tax=Legionella cincinnatiensis TaxID=28085 RepID=A0A378ILS9_9GAMM|nr:hypothetical protein Lcin_0585 [Legionella cincinnatiensis]STX36109.1 Uncharacterised protein [Legionella cincinnatiensis]